MSEEIKKQNNIESGSKNTGKKSVNSPTPAEDGKDNRSFEERFKEFVDKIHPYAARLWSEKKKFIVINVSVAVIFALYLLFNVHNYFQSTVTILPDYGNKQSTLAQLSGLASLAGVNVGQTVHTKIYQNLITSEVVLRPIIYAKYKTEKYPDSVNLIQYFKIKPDKNLNPILQKRKMFLQEFKSLVKGRISTNLDRLTQILTVTVKMPEAQLSTDVVNNITKSLEHYVQTQRKSYASDQVKYIKKRIEQIKDSLNFAEDTLTKFNEQNRVITQSPLLQLQQARLMRNVEILNGVYLELNKQLELAKIDVINDTPIVNVREYAKDPIIKAGPHRSIILIVILFFSVLISGTYIAFNDTIKKYYSYLGIDFRKKKTGKK